jgi:RNA polymerase sigma-70 factor, ECF subfamily
MFPARRICSNNFSRAAMNKKTEQNGVERNIQVETQEPETPLTDFPAESDALVVRSVADIRRTSDSVIEDEVIGFFGELRIPLRRYLAGFPLTVQDSEDVIQEVFLALFQYLRNGKSHQNVRGWLFRAAHNLALKKHLRSRKDVENVGALMAVEERVADPAPNPEDQFAFSKTQKRLMSVVRAMPEQNRWCLYLRAEGLHHREIAEVLDISLGSVSLYLERSLAHIAHAAER